LHYLQHVPFVEIAKMLGVTKGRISQLHKSAMARLRTSPVLEDLRKSA
jgi:RNA polymerase sigma factor for flagellar operon FliA